MSTSRADLLNLASAHYSPSLLAINENQIANIEWPIPSPMVVELPDSCAESPIDSVAFIIAMSSLNYRFWELLPSGGLERYRHGSKTGARALMKGFEEQWSNPGAPGKHFLHQLRQHGIEALFGPIPDSDSREAILIDVLAGDALEEISAELWRDINQTPCITLKQAAVLAQAWPSAFYDPYLKKAQLALAMAAAAIRAQGIVADTSDLTAFADYQVPRVLRALGVLTYSAELAAAVDGHLPLAEDSAEELAIRSATILACESIALQRGCTAAEVDNMLWLAQDVAGNSRFHLTYTTRY